MHGTNKTVQQCAFFFLINSNSDICIILNVQKINCVISKHWMGQKNSYCTLLIEVKKTSEVRLETGDKVIVLLWWVKVSENKQVKRQLTRFQLALDMKFWVSLCSDKLWSKTIMRVDCIWWYFEFLRLWWFMYNELGSMQKRNDHCLMQGIVLAFLLKDWGKTR
jgi:hypothetical protein